MFREDVKSLFAEGFYCHPHLVALHALRLVPIRYAQTTSMIIGHLHPYEIVDPGWFAGTDMVDSFCDICEKYGTLSAARAQVGGNDYSYFAELEWFKADPDQMVPYNRATLAARQPTRRVFQLQGDTRQVGVGAGYIFYQINPLFLAEIEQYKAQHGLHNLFDRNTLS